MSQLGYRRQQAENHGLKFNEKTHVYRLDGRWVPGVTSIIGVLDKPALPRWSAGEVAAWVLDNPAETDALREGDRWAALRELKGIPWRKRDDAATRGNVLHDYAEAMLNGEAVDVAAEHVPVMEHALAFMDEWAIRPVLVEAAVASREHWWAGTLDLIAHYVHPVSGRTGQAIFDWKSGKRIYASTAFQLNAYAHAEFWGLEGDEKPLPQCAAAFGVHITPEGYAVHPLPFGAHVYDEFLAIRRCYDINKRAEGDYKTAGSGYVGLPVPKREDVA